MTTKLSGTTLQGVIIPIPTELVEFVEKLREVGIELSLVIKRPADDYIEDLFNEQVRASMDGYEREIIKQTNEKKDSG